MMFGGPGGPVFPTKEEQTRIDLAEQRIHEKNWPSASTDTERATLSFHGLAIAIGSAAGIIALIIAIGWLVMG